MAKKKKTPLSKDANLQLVPIIRRRLSLLFLGGLLGAVAGAGYFLLSIPKYESKAEIIVMQNDSNTKASLDHSATQTNVSEELLATHLKIVQSKKVINDALEKHGLMELPSLLAELGETEGVSDYVRENLYVTTGGKGSARDAHVLNIAFRHTSQEDAQTVTIALIDEYQNYVKSKFQDINSKAVDLINKARIELEEEINELDEEYAEFRMNSPLLSGKNAGGDIYTVRYEELANQASSITMQIDEAKGRLDLVKSTLEQSKQSGTSHGLEKLALIDDRNASRLGILVTVERGKAESVAFQASQPERMAGAQAEYSSLLEKRAKLKRLSSEVGSRHPERRNLEEQIREMEEFLKTRSDLLVVDDDIQLNPDDIMDAYLKMLDNDLTALRNQLADVEKQMAIAEEEAKKLIALEIENEDLSRTRLRKEDLYSAAVDRLRSLNMQSDSSALILDVLEQPDLGKMVQPNLPVAAAICLLTALVFGGGSAAFAEYRDRSIHSPEELERIYSSSIIGHVPNFDKDSHAKKSILKAKQENAVFDPYLLAHHAPGSRASEGFRAMRTQAVFALGGTHKILCVTSGIEGAGKSTMASNLAVSLASSGHKVLLVDCDMRRPRIAKIFGLDNSRGLTTVLGGELDPTEAAIGGLVPNLWVMPSGKLPQNPAELLASDEFKNLIESLREKFDYIMLDCPPVLPVADPSIVAPLTDGVLVVSTIGHESKPQSERTSRILASVGSRVVGLIVNRVDEASSRYGYNAYGYESVKDNPYYATNESK
jgi:polysaccharide biosynthesis transport protein